MWKSWFGSGWLQNTKEWIWLYTICYGALATPKLYNYIYISIIYLQYSIWLHHMYIYILCLTSASCYCRDHDQTFPKSYLYAIEHTLSFQRFESFLPWCQRNRILTSSHRESNTSFPHAKCIHCKRVEKFDEPKKPQWQILGMMIVFQSSSHQNTCHLAKSIHVS